MYLYGASGHAMVIMDILKANKVNVDGLIDDDITKKEFLGYPIFCNKQGLSPLIISIGNNKSRKKIAESYTANFGVAVHPSAIVSESVKVGRGTVIMQGSIIQAGTNIGKHCIVNTGASIDHECVISDYVHISPHCTLCGNVQIGEGTWVGAGTTVIQGVKIGKWSVVGAGSVVTKDIPDNVVAYGSPCKVIRENTNI